MGILNDKENKMLRVESIRNFRVNLQNKKQKADIYVPKLTYKYNLANDTFTFKGLEDKRIVACKDTNGIAQELSDGTGVKIEATTSKKFQNGETYVRLMEDNKRKNIFVINAGIDPINDNLMEFRQLINAAKYDGASQVTAVMPYMPYARQDRLSKKGEALAAKMIAKDIETAGANKVIVFDMHSAQIQGFFDIPVENISAMPLFANYFREKGNLDSFIVVSPDAGGKKRAKELAEELKLGYAQIDKDRAEHNVACAKGISGNVSGKNCIVFDDIIDTAGTINESVRILKENGAKDVYICATHGIFSGDAYKNIEKSDAKEVVVTDSLKLKDGASPKIKQLSLAPLLEEDLAA